MTSILIHREPVYEAVCKRCINDVPRHELGEPIRHVVALDLLEHEIAGEVRRTTQRHGGGLHVVLEKGGAHLAQLATELLVTS